MKPTSAAELPALLTLGATRVQLAKLGYRAVSAFTLPRRPAEFPATPVPELFHQMPEPLLSEHPVGVACGGGEPALALLILGPIADEELAARAKKLLAEMLTGPVRIGSDGWETRPLRLKGFLKHSSASALSGAVSLVSDRIMPLDGTWTPVGGLLSTPADKLPEITAAAAIETLEAADWLPTRLESERRPPPKPSRHGWIGR